MGTAIALPPPYLGQKDDLPLAVVENPYAERVYNYNLDNGIPTIRHGDLAWFRGGATSELCLHLATYGIGSSQLMFAVFDQAEVGEIYFADVSIYNTKVDVHNVPFGGDDYIQSLFFNNYLFFFGEVSLLPSVNGPQYYNGAAWGAAGYTYPTGYAAPFGGGVYKNRAYLIVYQSAKYVYTDIDAISGATTGVDLSSVINNSGYLYGIKSIGLSEGIQQENVLAFIFSTGEVLVYNGSYPGSSTWGLIGRFVIPKPLSYNAFVDAKGDTFIITESGLVSLRTLFTQGSEIAIREGLSKSIANRWKEIFSEYSDTGSYFFYNLYIKGIFDSAKNRIIITIPVVEGTITKTARLIYSFETNSWAEAIVVVPTLRYTSSAVYFQNSPFYGSFSNIGVFQIEGKSDFMDDQVTGVAAEGIQYNLRTAPLPTGKFGANRITGIELISKTDLHAETNYTLVSNLGQNTTNNQKLPSQGTGIANPMIDIGTVGNYVQLDISGTTTSSTSIGQSIYAMNVWLEPGKEGSR